MSVLYIALPVALLLGAGGLLACIMTIRSGQYDDLESPPLRMLMEDPPKNGSLDEEDGSQESGGYDCGS